jgi:hypothetical protein
MPLFSCCGFAACLFSGIAVSRLYCLAASRSYCFPFYRFAAIPQTIDAFMTPMKPPATIRGAASILEQIDCAMLIFRVDLEIGLQLS